MININILPFPNLESERLRFREINILDLNKVKEIRGNAETMKFIPRPLVLTDENALQHINLVLEKRKENDALNWVITSKEDDVFMGIIGFFRTQHEHLRSELGYMLLPQHHNKGFVSEAIKTVLKHGFNTLNLHSVCAVIDLRNKASARVLEKNGFKKEAHFVEDFYWNNEFIDSVHYGLLRREFGKNQVK